MANLKLVKEVVDGATSGVDPSQANPNTALTSGRGLSNETEEEGKTALTPKKTYATNRSGSKPVLNIVPRFNLPRNVSGSTLACNALSKEGAMRIGVKKEMPKLNNPSPLSKQQQQFNFTLPSSSTPSPFKRVSTIERNEPVFLLKGPITFNCFSAHLECPNCACSLVLADAFYSAFLCLVNDLNRKIELKKEEEGFIIEVEKFTRTLTTILDGVDVVDNSVEEAEQASRNKKQHSLNGNPPKGKKHSSKKVAIKGIRSILKKEKKKEESRKGRSRESSRPSSRASSRSRSRSRSRPNTPASFEKSTIAKIEKQITKPIQGKYVKNSDSPYTSDPNAHKLAGLVAQRCLPGTLSLMEQALQPDGRKGEQQGDPAIRRHNDPVLLPIAIPSNRVSSTIVSNQIVSVPPGYFFLVETALNVQADGADPSADNMGPGSIYNQTYCLIENPNEMANYHQAPNESVPQIYTVDPYLYNSRDQGLGTDADPSLNKLSSGSMNTYDWDAAAVNAFRTTFGLTGGVTQPLPLNTPSGFVEAINVTGGYQRVQCRFNNTLDTGRLYTVVLKAGSVPENGSSDAIEDVEFGGEDVTVTFPAQDFSYPGPFAHYCHGAPMTAQPWPSMAYFTDTTSPIVGNTLVPTSCLVNAVLVATGVLDVNQAFDEQFYVLSQAPQVSTPISPADGLECGIKTRHPVWDDAQVSYGSYGPKFGSNFNLSGDTYFPSRIPITDTPAVGSSRILTFMYNSGNAAIELNISSVTYIDLSYDALMVHKLENPLYDPFLMTARSLALEYPVFSKPNSFGDWLKGAANSVWGAIKEVGSAALDTVVKVLPGVAMKALGG